MDTQKLIIIAAYLKNWKLDTRNPHRPYLINGAGLSILISHEKGQRLRLSGKAPSDSHGRQYGFQYWLGRDTEYPQITVSQNREAASIARDIERRLIPAYISLYTQTKDAINKHEESIKWCDHIEGLFTQMLNGTPPYNGRSQQRRETRRRVCFGDYRARSGSGQLTVSQ